MLSQVENTISRYSMIPQGEPLGVAVSGGADSVFLLHALRQLTASPLIVLHVNHGLRGEESEADERFVRSLHGDVRVYRMPAPEGNLEQFCRRARHAWFASLVKDGVVTRVATGHTADDQAETVLMRLLRGTGPAGLRGVLPVTREGLVRPLLEVGREEIRGFLLAHGIGWREDSTNASNRFLRNRIRNEVLPLLTALQPRVVRALGQTAALALTDEAYWRERTKGTKSELDVEELRAMHPALAGRAVRAGIEAALGDLHRIEQGHIEEILRLAAKPAGGGRVDIPGGAAVRSFGTLRIQGPGAGPEPSVEVRLPFRGERNGYSISIEAGRPDCGPESLDLERIDGDLRLKSWEPNDRFQAHDAATPRPVREFFQKLRVPSWERPFWPMITDSAGIVWIHRVGTGRRTAVTQATRHALQIRCHKVSSK